MPAKKHVVSADEDYWNFVKKTAEEVAKWPSWMRGSTAEVRVQPHLKKLKKEVKVEKKR